jgi:hypothetical protein
MVWGWPKPLPNHLGVAKPLPWLMGVVRLPPKGQMRVVETTPKPFGGVSAASTSHGMVRPSPKGRYGHPLSFFISLFFYFFLFLIIFNGGNFGIQTLVHGAILESFALKNSCAVHLSNFPSNKTAMANEVAKLKILEIWLGYIANF